MNEVNVVVRAIVGIVRKIITYIRYTSQPNSVALGSGSTLSGDLFKSL